MDRFEFFNKAKGKKCRMKDWNWEEKFFIPKHYDKYINRFYGTNERGVENSWAFDNPDDWEIIEEEDQATTQDTSMTVIIRLQEASQPLKFKNIQTTYTKGPMFCLRLADNSTLKFPLINIFTVLEE